ncbi:MAG: adenylosuccinate lyase [Thermoprotei archaeon]
MEHPILSRYSYPEMRYVFSEEAKLERWLKVEGALAKAHALVGNIPLEAAEIIISKASLKYVKPDRVRELEHIYEHDLFAMVEALAEVCNDAGKYVHLGATSYDIEDTALALALRDALSIIEDDLFSLRDTLIDLAVRHRDLVCIGRTHGQHALPITYGMKFALWAAEIQRHIERLNEVRKRAVVGKMSGAVGTMAGFSQHGIKIQELVMKELGLNYEPISNQVVQRDRHAEVIMLLALIASSLDKIAKEIRNLQRTEVAEVFEPFEEKQAGSSTMPHKRNPNKSERICSLARYVKALVIPSLENISLEHERDLTNSANERIIIPDAFMIVDYMLRQMNNILKKLEINEKNIKRNLELTDGLIMAERIMLELVRKGVPRQEAYKIVRNLSFKSIKEGKLFREVLESDPTISKLIDKSSLEVLINPYTYIGNSREIVSNVVTMLKSKR